MSKNKLISGIELGSSKITTIIAQTSKDQYSTNKEVSIVGISSVESRGIKKGQIVNIEEAVDATVSSVEGAERMAGVNLDSAFVAIGGASITSQNSHGVVAVSNPDGEIGQSDVDRVIEAASAISLPNSREIIHVIPREFIVDGESGVRDPIGMSGVRLEVNTHLVTASTASIKNLKKALNQVGVNVLELVYSGLAASEGVLTKTEKELGCCLIDIGGGTTSIAVFIDGSLSYSGVLPIGAGNVTNDLAIGLRVSLESAEKIKVTLSQEEDKKKKIKDSSIDEIDLNSLGVSDSKKVSRKTLIDGIIRPRLNEIFTMVRLQLDRENVSSKIPSGVVLTGGGAETVGVVESARRMMALPVRVGQPKGINGLIDDIVSPLYSTPVGLVIHAANEEDLEHTSSFSGKIKLPSKGILGKLIGIVKDLLP